MRENDLDFLKKIYPLYFDITEEEYQSTQKAVIFLL